MRNKANRGRSKTRLRTNARITGNSRKSGSERGSRSCSDSKRTVQSNDKPETARSWEPVYHAITGKHGKVVRAWWSCPHCGMEFRARKSCSMHCQGKQGSYGPTCPALRGDKRGSDENNVDLHRRSQRRDAMRPNLRDGHNANSENNTNKPRLRNSPAKPKRVD